MENGPFIEDKHDDLPIQDGDFPKRYVIPIHLPIENDGFSMATLSNQRVYIYIYILVGG